MSASAAYFLAHDAHRPDSRASEASYSRRSSLNPFHRNSYSESHPETQEERRRSSVVEFAKKVAHAVAHEVHENQRAFEVFYGRDWEREKAMKAKEEETRRRRSSAKAEVEAPLSAEEEERRVNEVY